MAGGGRNGVAGGFGFFFLKEGKGDKARKITEKNPKTFFRNYVKMCIFENSNSGFLHIPCVNFLGIQGGGVVNTLPCSKVNSFLIFIIFFSWNKGIWGTYSCSSLLTGCPKSGVTQVWASTKLC